MQWECEWRPSIRVEVYDPWQKQSALRSSIAYKIGDHDVKFPRKKSRKCTLGKAFRLPYFAPRQRRRSLEC